MMVSVLGMTVAGLQPHLQHRQSKSKSRNGQRDGQRWRTYRLAPVHLRGVEDQYVAGRTGERQRRTHQGNGQPMPWRWLVAALLQIVFGVGNSRLASGTPKTYMQTGLQARLRLRLLAASSLADFPRRYPGAEIRISGPNRHETLSDWLIWTKLKVYYFFRSDWM